MDTLEKQAASKAGMIRIPGGTFRMGSDRHYPKEAPVHNVTVDGFWIDPTPVTNAQFRTFVRATGHVTWAEIPPDPALTGTGSSTISVTSMARWKRSASS